MAHQPGWIELYSILEKGGKPNQRLVEQCQLSKTGIGETMLHWYAVEGCPDVLQKLIDLDRNTGADHENNRRHTNLRGRHAWSSI